MKKKITKFELIKKFIKENILEIILVIGLFFIVLASMLIDIIIGFYTLGFFLIILSLYIARR